MHSAFSSAQPLKKPKSSVGSSGLWWFEPDFFAWCIGQYGILATSGGIDLSPFQVADWREDYQQSFTVPDWFVQHQSDLTGSLERIQCPVLLIWGDADPISPVALGQALHRQIPHAELHIVSQGQHDLAYVHAEHVAQLIQNFLVKLRV